MVGHERQNRREPHFGFRSGLASLGCAVVLAVTATISISAAAERTGANPVVNVVIERSRDEFGSHVKVRAAVGNRGSRSILVAPADVRIFAGRRLPTDDDSYARLTVSACDVYQVSGHGDTYTVSYPSGVPQPPPTPTPEATSMPTPAPTATPAPPVTVSPGETVRIGPTYWFGEFDACGAHQVAGSSVTYVVYADVTWRFAGDPRPHAITSERVPVTSVP